MEIIRYNTMEKQQKTTTFEINLQTIYIPVALISEILVHIAILVHFNTNYFSPMYQVQGAICFKLWMTGCVFVIRRYLRQGNTVLMPTFVNHNARLG